MALGALVDAGADLDEVPRLLRAPARGRLALEAEPVLRCGIGGHQGPRARRADPRSRTAAHIVGLVEERGSPTGCATGRWRRSRRWPRSRATSTGAARAGALPRGRRLDAIIDVVGTCAALEVLGIDEVARQPGRQRHRHGAHRARADAQPRPRGGRAARARRPTASTSPWSSPRRPARRCSPPTSRRVGPDAGHAHRRAGFGAGTAELDDRPNLTQVVIGSGPTRSTPGQPVMLLEVNVDDATGEQLAHAVAELLDAGAHDAWLTPIVMKKGRPAHTVSALVDPSLAAEVRRCSPARPVRSGCGARP